MSKPLFNEFDWVSAKQWKQKIQFDLKGADYNDSLVWNTNDDVSVKPFYHHDDVKEFQTPSTTKASTWKIGETIFVKDVEKSNHKAIDSLNRGAESITFIIPSDNISVVDLLKSIDLSSAEIHFQPLFLSPNFVKNISVISQKTGFHIHNDIIGNLARTGNWFNNLNDDFIKFKSVLEQNPTLSVDVSLYQNAGASMVQQLAYALAHANEYLNHLNNDEVAKNEIMWQSLKCHFNVSVGSNYFFEIAKLRALRTLWSSLASEYSINSNCQIFASPTKRNKTIYDFNTNLLRTTTECMSAILGGANTINNLPYDFVYHKSNEFGDRIARNQLLVLRHESYFDKVDNPSDGSYYIECLTNQLAEKALTLFKDIEANGGFLKQLKDGIIQRKIKEMAAKEQTQFNSGEEVLLGTNKYINEKDKMKADLELYPFVKTNKRKTLIEPIIEKRLAENLEQERLKTENQE